MEGINLSELQLSCFAIVVNILKKFRDDKIIKNMPTVQDSFLGAKSRKGGAEVCEGFNFAKSCKRSKVLLIEFSL